ncbi:MAG: DNA polymerase III subunit beta [Proteobacteria bacterium]|nr:DNA polymerase III subunit beta [Pseudomonadota bacterium]
MELFINTKELNNELNKVQGIVSRASQGTIYTHVHFEAKDSTLTITATDNKMTLISRCENVRVIEEGSLCIKGKKILQIIKTVDGENTHLKASGVKLQLHSGSAKFDILECRDAWEFPQTRQLDATAKITVTSTALKRLIDETVFAISDELERASLIGASLEQCTNEEGYPVLRMVTTDGNRLSISETSFEGDLSDEITNILNNMLIPKSALLELRKLCDSSGDKWIINFGTQEAEFQCESTIFQFLLIEGHFPDYNRILSTLNLTNSAIVNRRHLQSIFKRVFAMVNRRDLSVSFSFSEDFLEISAENADFGTFKEQMNISFEGEELTIAFNLQYIQDVLNALREEFLRMELGGNISPCLVKNPDSEEAKFIVMPMRIR